MKVWDINDSFSLKRPVATIGIFDGVHSGHKFILDHLISRARKHGGESVVVTLWPHPRIVLNKELHHFKLLHTQEEKIREMERHGVDHLLIVPFDREIASLTACDFVQKYLVDKLGVEVLLVGYDNRFGKDRKGDPEGLSMCAEKNRFIIEKIPEYLLEHGGVSSTGIREAILRGDLETARKLLGYHYYLSGTIVEGNHIGRKMGFPTANIHPRHPYKLIPMNGVYAIRTELRGGLYNGMLNIGFRPTIDSAMAVKTIEAHLFEITGDFYNEEVVIHFVKRVRDEMKFSGLDALKKQLQKDKENIQNILY
ncbi:MAG: bifunctional riboflavin kinase/FAD synthetase [Bacteroidales bacterium]|nr:bifunctional riboflavin kinase/FAD synthetase [Bacteroidales bacterium]